MIIIMRFGENNVLGPKYIDIYDFGRFGGTYIFHRTFLGYYSKISEKVQEHDLYYNQILHHFDLTIFFPKMNNKKFTKSGPLLFLYELSIVVLIDFIAILLTPGIFLI